MAYEKPITIKDAIIAIADDKFLLPAIQREFIWGTEQIESLFDSLMKSFPISTFLFWKVQSVNVHKFKFYRFLKNYHERDSRHNIEASFSNNHDITAVLDGQQRLTSIYIALMGEYSERLTHHSRKSDHAYPPKTLHLNLLGKRNIDNFEYEFRFLTQKETVKKDTNHYWVPVKKVLQFSQYEDAADWVSDLIDDLSEEFGEPLGKEIKKESRKKFCNLYRVICEKEVINYYLETSPEIEKVLQIFIRINQGGTQLSYSDLLLSIATAQWKTLDARKEIHSFVDLINDIDQGFNFSKDFVLKCCLVLAKIENIAFKVDNFTSQNMSIIEDKWNSISFYIELTINLISQLGFNNKILKSANSLIPIAYFLSSKNIGSEVLNSSSFQNNRDNIKLWLIRALLKKHFGGATDTLHYSYFSIIDKCDERFPLNSIFSHFQGTNKSLDFYPEDIDNLLSSNYGSTNSSLILLLLHPSHRDCRYHVDHIFPKKILSLRSLSKLGYHDIDAKEYSELCNQLPNLQLLHATPNMEKGTTMPEDWLSQSYPNQQQINLHKQLNLIPVDITLSLDNFKEFFHERSLLIRSNLKSILDLN